MSEDTDDGSVYSTDQSTDNVQSPRAKSRASSRVASAAPSHTASYDAEADSIHYKEGVGPKTARLKSRRTKRGYYSKAYRELYNTAIAEATGHPSTDENHHTDLRPSQNGASLWSVAEKQIFFRKLATNGKDDIAGIAAAIDGKTASEVRDLILLLQEGVVEDSLSDERAIFGLDAIPAAYEINHECETALDMAAGVLARKVEDWEEKRELQRHGDYWLLTDSIATDFEEILAARDDQDPDVQPTTQIDDHNDDDEHDDDNDDGNYGNDGAYHDSGSEMHGPSVAPPTLPVPAANLLHLEKWLRLSQLFMNHSLDPDLPAGWYSVTGSEDKSTSIYRTAFDDLHNLAISLTRRLMQAAVFQALSRLRATERQVQALAVRRQDVRAAAEILGLKDDWHEFWGRVPRRHKLDVYTTLAKYQDGRPTKHNTSVFLNYDEVEAELGVAQLDTRPAEHEQSVCGTVEEDAELEALYVDEDLWTELSYSDNDNTDDNDADTSASKTAVADADTDPDMKPSGRNAHTNNMSDVSGSEYHDSSEINDDDPASPANSTGTWHERHRERKHRRKTDTRAQDRAEDDFLNALDARSSAAEGARLWAVLGRVPAQHIKDEDGQDAESLLAPPRKRRRKTRGAEQGHRQDRVEFRAEWERFEVPVEESAFREMEQRGQRDRKRRRAVRDEVVRRGPKEIEERGAVEGANGDSARSVTISDDDGAEVVEEESSVSIDASDVQMGEVEEEEEEEDEEEDVEEDEEEAEKDEGGKVEEPRVADDDSVRSSDVDMMEAETLHHDDVL